MGIISAILFLSELISIIEGEKEFLNKRIEEYFSDLSTSHTAEEELKVLQMALFSCKENLTLGATDIALDGSIEKKLSPSSFEEFQMSSATDVEATKSEEFWYLYKSLQNWNNTVKIGKLCDHLVLHM